MRRQRIGLLLFGLTALSFTSCGDNKSGNEKVEISPAAKASATPIPDPEELWRERAREAKVMADIKNIDLAVATHYLETGLTEYAPTLELLTMPDAFGKVLLKREHLMDPWGVPYHYDARGSRNIKLLGDPKPDIWCERDGHYFCNWKAGKQKGPVPKF